MLLVSIIVPSRPQGGPPASWRSILASGQPLPDCVSADQLFACKQRKMTFDYGAPAEQSVSMLAGPLGIGSQGLWFLMRSFQDIGQVGYVPFPEEHCRDINKMYIFQNMFANKRGSRPHVFKYDWSQPLYARRPNICIRISRQYLCIRPINETGKYNARIAGVLQLVFKR